MSIYSGFATRSLQHLYDKLTFGLIKLLQKRLIKFYLGLDSDEKAFNNYLTKVVTNLASLE